MHCERCALNLVHIKQYNISFSIIILVLLMLNYMLYSTSEEIPNTPVKDTSPLGLEIGSGCGGGCCGGVIGG